MAISVDVLDVPASACHVVQLYESDEKALARNVARFIGSGLKRGAAAIVIATEKHEKTILEQLRRTGIKPESAIGTSRLSILDAGATLARLMVDGVPDASCFDAIVGKAVRKALTCSENHEVLAYGEMVGELWKGKRHQAAIRLEQLWSGLLQSVPLSLFCGYPIDVFDSTLELATFDALICAHTHLVPSWQNGSLDHAVNKAVEEVLGCSADQLSAWSAAYERWPAALPKGEAALMWLRHNLPHRAGEIFDLARTYYYAARPAEA